MLCPLVLFLLACGPSADPEPPPKIEAPKTASEAIETSDPQAVELVDADGLKALLEGPHTRHQVVNFWATWCAPCIEELPRFRDWAQAQERADLVLVNVDIVQVRERLVQPFVEKHGLDEFRNVQLNDRDPATGLQKVLPEFSGILPFTLVIQPEGGQNRTVLLGSVHTDRLDDVIDSN